MRFAATQRILPTVAAHERSNCSRVTDSFRIWKFCVCSRKISLTSQWNRPHQSPISRHEVTLLFLIFGSRQSPDISAPTWDRVQIYQQCLYNFTYQEINAHGNIVHYLVHFSKNPRVTYKLNVNFAKIVRKISKECWFSSHRVSSPF